MRLVFETQEPVWHKPGAAPLLPFAKVRDHPEITQRSPSDHPALDTPRPTDTATRGPGPGAAQRDPGRQVAPGGRGGRGRGRERQVREPITAGHRQGRPSGGGGSF